MPSKISKGISTERPNRKGQPRIPSVRKCGFCGRRLRGARATDAEFAPGMVHCATCERSMRVEPHD